MIRVLLADDHPIVRQGLRTLLESECDCQVVGEAADGLTAVDLISQLTTDLILALHTVMSGNRFLSAALSERAIEHYAVRAQEVSSPLDRYDLLTNREREVLQLAAQGMTNTEIGQRLAISPRTAETHRLNLPRKLTFTTHTELVRFAISRGLLSETP